MCELTHVMAGERHGRGMGTAWARHGNGTLCMCESALNQTRSHCVNQMGKTHSKPLAARHDRGKALARHVMCESALKHGAPRGLASIPHHSVDVSSAWSKLP